MSLRWIRMEVREHVPSTNDGVLEWLSRGVSDVVVMARTMSQGRGRSGHRWEAPPGGLWISMGWNHLSVEDALHLAFYAPLAVVRTVETWGVPARIRIPNDVFLSGRKLAGILVERRGAHTVLGVGINVSNPLPASLRNRAIRLADYLASPPHPLQVAYVLLEAVLDLLEGDLTDPSTLVAWHARLDTPRRFRGFSGNRPVEGEFLHAVSPGNIRVRLPDGGIQTLSLHTLHDLTWYE